MLKVCVFDVAASTRGATTILEGFYNEAILDKDISWLFVLSTCELKESDSVKVKNYRWIKRSRIHRLLFDYFIVPQILKEEKPDCIISLQNICAYNNCLKQILYIQQSIPFASIKFGLRKSPIEWMYQNIISRFIFKSAIKADKIVVQTKWMRDAIAKRLSIQKEKILVTNPEINIKIEKTYIDNQIARRTFFYPAAYASYKNHAVIMEASKILLKRGMSDFKIIFTVSENELKFKNTEKIPIEYVGNIPYIDVLNYYSRSVLIFPSKLETFGLPLLEAGLTGSRILASDMPFSHEVLEGYKNVRYFNPEIPEKVADLMEQTIFGQIQYQDTTNEWYYDREANVGWKPVIDLVKKI